jgi:hypothetical protein
MLVSVGVGAFYGNDSICICVPLAILDFHVAWQEHHAIEGLNNAVLLNLSL